MSEQVEAAAPDLPPPLSPKQSARMQRVEDYETQSLTERNPLLATLGSVNSGLMRIALSMEDVIVEALQMGSPRIQRLPQFQGSIETYLRVTRQIDRFAQLSLRTSEVQKQTKRRQQTGAKTADPARPRLSPKDDSET